MEIALGHTYRWHATTNVGCDTCQWCCSKKNSKGGLQNLRLKV